ncbi:hypothetical protein GcC1_190016 [Golovinomyces cichoracearum]|uniref:Altered inheritance of mitochondria protein 41 n=1 Tax=Golovinomyces cichoracearum TaxID=62708 RepID=A0A420HIS3_9PEZI|nr:hypothetical protein GcC1_190016 [Golovinomyces cichoracearum]
MLNRSILRASSRLLCRRYATETLSSASAKSTSATTDAGLIGDAPQGPPILLKIREDLKTATQNNETFKQSVIQNLVDATQTKPIKTDIQVLALINKARKESDVAIEHFKIAERQDLVEKQEETNRILDEYSSSIETISTEKIRAIVDKIIADCKSRNEPAKFGHVLNRAFKHPELPFEKVGRAEVLRVVQEAMPYERHGSSLTLQISRKDLKIALQNKETVKLTVIRSLINATRAKPIKNDIHVLALINKAKKENQMAIDHYKVAGRQDLVEKQEAIAGILEEYAGSVETISPEIVKKVVEEIIENFKARNEKVVHQQVLIKALKSPKLPSDKLDKADVLKVLQEILPFGKSGASK